MKREDVNKSERGSQTESDGEGQPNSLACLESLKGIDLSVSR